MERAYTVKEIDALREVCRTKWLYGRYNRPTSAISCSYLQTDLDKGVEELVRTHMIAGHTANDLLDSEKST